MFPVPVTGAHPVADTLMFVRPEPSPENCVAETVPPDVKLPEMKALP